jgi:hypothetical protein
MESLRKRFMTSRPLGESAASPELNNESGSSSSKSPGKQFPIHDNSTIVIKISTSKRIVFSNGVVTLYGSPGVTDVSTSSSPEAKILTLECLHDLLRLQEREDLNPNTESLVVSRIIETFASKSDCIQAIDQRVSVAEHRRVLTSWAMDVWGEDPQKNLNQDDSDKESYAGSLFSDSDVQEIPDNRIRPITLRPRKSSQPAPITVVVKTEVDKAFQKRPSEVKANKEIRNPKPSLSSPQVRRGSPSRNIREHSPRSQHQVRPPLTSRTQSLPSQRHQSSPLNFSEDPRATGKRAIRMRENIAPEDHRVKRVKSMDGMPDRKPTSDKSSPQKPNISRKGEPTSLAGAPNFDPGKPDSFSTPATVSSAESLSRCWREITANFPPDVKMLPTIDRLAYYFREAELAKKENEILKRDESERRKSMLLLAEKIELMNQPVARGCTSGNTGIK